VETAIRGRGHSGESERLATCVALPSAKHPHLLVVDDSREVARRALETYTDARRRVRAAAALLAAGARADLPQLIGDRVHVSPAVDQPLIARPPLTEYLADVLDRDDLVVAVRMGGQRPNRKPVLQLLTRTGQILAYAKVGWNDLTRALVRNEAEILVAFAESRGEPASFSVPTLIHAGRCGELDVLVIAPVSPVSWLSGRPPLAEVLAASREIASLNPQTREPLAESAWWRDTRARLDGLHGIVRESRFEVLLDLLALIEERYGDAELLFGGWHGDWTCWNMGRRGSKLVILDWERSGPTVPVGLDAAHYDFDAAVMFRRKPSLESVRQLLGGGGSLLPAFAPSPRLARLFVSLDLLEMVLRFEEARSAGLDIIDTVYFGALRSAVLAPPTHG
jgi:hypothetical protein